MPLGRQRHGCDVQPLMSVGALAAMAREARQADKTGREVKSWAGKASKGQAAQEASDQSRPSVDDQARSIDAINKAECGRSVRLLSSSRAAAVGRVWPNWPAVGDREPSLRGGSGGRRKASCVSSAAKK